MSFLFKLALQVALVFAVSASARANEYRIDTGDKLSVRVHEWRAQRGEFFEYTAYANATFSVGPSGTVALPLVGEIPARGATQQEVAERLAVALQHRIGLVQRPIAVVEVTEFRPFFIVGGVESPGSYPFQPGLNVLEAVTIAGGLSRQRDPAALRLERESITTRGDLTVLALRIQALEARRLRLQAEMADAELVQVTPDEERASPGIGALVREEQLILTTRREGVRRQTEAANQVIQFLRAETESLRQRIAVKNEQIASVEKELVTIRSLVERGFAISPRQLQLERSLADYQSDELSLQTAVLRAQQEIYRTERSVAEYIDKRRTEIATELRTTQSDIEEAKEKAQTAQRLIYESEVTARTLVPRPVREQIEPTFSVVRRDPNTGQSVEVDVSEATPVQPGDVVKVHLPIPGVPRLPRSARPITSGSLAPPAAN